MLPGKPSTIFDRDDEWRDLGRFATHDRQGATLGVVSGRRRQGKTLLLSELAKELGGFYFGATESTEAESLRRLGDSIGQHTLAVAPLRLVDWEQAIDALLALGRARPTVVVLDEFPYLCRATRALPSIIQHALTPGRAERTESRARLLLCGSALSFMGKLLSGTAPLRGRAGLSLVVHPLNYRQAAEFWGITDPRLAAQVYSIVGGTPAYRREYVDDDAPADLADFDRWIVRTVLNPARPLLGEARYLLAEDPDLREPALYHSVLAAVADGNATSGGIASYIGREATDIRHPLTVLEDAGLLARQPDPLRKGKSSYHITEPLITFYQSVIRPAWTQLGLRRGDEVWRRSGERFASKVLGPGFEDLVRTWAQRFVAPATFGAPVVEVGHGIVRGSTAHSEIQLDLIAFGAPQVGVHDRTGRLLVAIGETKWGKQLNVAHLARLERARELLRNRDGINAKHTHLVLTSAAGFAAELRAAADRRSDVHLVDLERLYHGE